MYRTRRTPDIQRSPYTGAYVQTSEHTTHPENAPQRKAVQALGHPQPGTRTMWAHQRAMFGYTVKTQHPALFVEMRLGKCLVTIRTVQRYPAGRVLVVAPNSAIPSWVDELKAEGENAVWVKGTRLHRLRALASRHRWYVVNPEAHRSIPQLARFDWLAVVLDESTFIKNPRAQVTRYFTERFRLVSHRWVLTGTPAPEKDWDVFCQLQFLDGQAFGVRNFWQFRTKYYSPPLQQGEYDWQPKPGTKRAVGQYLQRRAFVMRRRDVGVEAHRVYERRALDFTPEMRKAYTTAERDFVLEHRGKRIDSTVWATQRFIWMRRMCGGFVGDRLVWDGKFRELESLVTGELAGESVVVWFEYVKELTTAADRLRKLGVNVRSLWGKVTPEERLDVFHAFQRGRVRVLCVQHQVAQMGANLSASDTAIYFSAPLPLLVRKQTEDRILNLNKSSSLLYLDLAVTDTVEADMLQAVRAKGLRSGLLMNAKLWAAIGGRHREAS